MKLHITLAVLLISNSHFFCAADLNSETTGSSTFDSNVVSVTSASESRELDRNILLKMPYFRARFHPALYMRTIPMYAKYIDTFKNALMTQSEKIQEKPSISLPDGTDINDFMFLYNELSRMPQNESIPIDVIVKEISRSGYATPKKMISIINLAQKVLTVPPILPFLDRFWINMIQERLATPDGTIAKAFFAPQEHMLETILALIKAEKKEISIACYRMTHPEIICELGRAKKRGVHVRVIVDSESADDEDIKKINRAGIYLYLWGRKWFDTKPIMHNKFYLFSQNINDQALLVTGSANCTWSAQEANEENIVILNDSTLITQFEKQFNNLKFFSTYMEPEDPDAAYASINASCIKLDEALIDRFTPQARRLFIALARLFAEYILAGLVESFGISSLETEWEVTKQLKELSPKTGSLE